MNHDAILEYFTVGAGLLVPTLTPGENGSHNLTLIYSGGCDPGDVLDINLKETEQGVWMDGLLVHPDWLLQRLDTYADEKRERLQIIEALREG